jgi:predicted XRE-type DNA-binding protein
MKQSIPIGTLCSECAQYKGCTTLCTHAEAYVGQDYITLQESTIGLPRYSKGNVFMTKSNEEIIISLHFKKRLKQQEIANIIGINQSHVSRVLKKYHSIIVDNLKNKSYLVQ